MRQWDENSLQVIKADSIILVKDIFSPTAYFDC